jgi:hypothetical protein
VARELPVQKSEPARQIAEKIAVPIAIKKMVVTANPRSQTLMSTILRIMSAPIAMQTALTYSSFCPMGSLNRILE